MLQPIESPPALVRPAVGGLHQAWAPAGDDGEAGLGQGLAHPPGRLVHRVVLAEPRRAEDRDRGADLGQCVDPVDELPLDAEDPPGFGVREGAHLRRPGPRRRRYRPIQQLLVLGRPGFPDARRGPQVARPSARKRLGGRTVLAMGSEVIPRVILEIISTHETKPSIPTEDRRRTARPGEGPDPPGVDGTHSIRGHLDGLPPVLRRRTGDGPGVVAIRGRPPIGTPGLPRRGESAV